MSVLIVSRRNVLGNARVRAQAHVLRTAGHALTIVCPNAGDTSIDDVEVPQVATRYPTRWGPVGMVLRRIQPVSLRASILDRKLVETGVSFSPDLVMGATDDDVDLAERIAASVGGAVIRPFEGRSAGEVDLIDLAPERIDLASSPAGEGLPYFGPADDRPPSAPRPGRHAGAHVVVVGTMAPTSPASYLVPALEEAGVRVTTAVEDFDWETLDRRTEAVVFVESPYPAVEVRGRNPGVPVLFWVHHGEHHLAANLRLVDRYGVDAVLLAHSWHLAPWFPVPVHRFPFATAPSMADPSKPHADRRFDVAMVGAGVDGDKPVYARRHRLAEALTDALGTGAVAFRSGVQPREMMRIYGDARIVTNDGGTRHAPITMRVFESIGAGAALATDELPGMTMLFPASDYATLDERGVPTIERLLADPDETQAMADRALAHASGHHTYAHRVDELLAVAGATEHRDRPAARPQTPLGVAIDDDVDVQRIAAYGSPQLASDLPNREIVDVRDVLPPSSIDSVAVGASERHRVAELALAARRFVYVEDARPDIVDTLGSLDRPCSVTIDRGVVRGDFHAPGYRRDQVYGGGG